MKCLLCEAFGPIDDLKLHDLPDLVPGPGQVRIDVAAAALNYPDALMVQGLYQVKPALPFVPGMEYAGTVSAVGPDVTTAAVGDRVVSFGAGGFAQQALADARQLQRVPASMDLETAAATFLTYGTSLRALKDRGRLAAGETLLVLGAAGGVGIAAVEIGKALGARVIAAASSDDKLALCRRLGADDTINYATENLRERLKALVGRKGLDVVYDPVGGALTEEALRSLGWGGRLLVIGFASGTIPKLPANLALLNERSVIGTYWGDSLVRDPAANERNVRQLVEWHATGAIRPLISERVPLAGTMAAMHRMAARQVVGKVLIIPGV